MSFLLDVARWFADAAHWQGGDGIPLRFGEHVAMAAASVAAACAIALPVGIALGHIGRGGAVAVNVANAGRAIPSFALLVLALQVFGIGAPPAFVALVVLAVPPILLNSYVGVREVDTDVREAGRAMGMTGGQLLFGIEMPVALPLVMAGVRTASVQVVASATLAALVAWGGLGRYIIDGILLRDFVRVFAGALLVAVLSVVTEVALAGLQQALTPAGLRAGRAGRGEAFAGAASGLEAA